MSEYALRLENSTDTAPRVRMGDTLAQQPAGVLQARGGLRNDGGGAVTAVAGTMGVSVAPLMAWVDGGSSLAQGGYPFTLDAAKVLTLADGHASLARVDTIAVVVRDNTFDGGGLTTAAVEVIQGTPGSGAPALPASAVPLRDVNVPAGLSAGTGGLSAGNLSTDRRVYTAAAGGVLRVASQTARDALGAQPGQVVYRVDSDVLQVYNGASWKTYSADPSAWNTYTPTWTNMALGTGAANTGRYIVRGTKVKVAAEVTLGTGSSVSGSIIMSIPVPARSLTPGHVGTSFASSASTRRGALTELNTVNDVVFVQMDNGAILGVGAPFVWGSGATLRVELEYESA